MRDLDLAARWLDALAPPSPCSISEYAERTLTLPAGANAIAGPLRLHAYQKGMADAIMEPGVTRVVYQCAAQIGKSLNLLSAFAYFVGQEPSPILFVSPTDGANAALTRERIDPLIKASPALRDLIGADKRADNAQLKLFPGGYTAFASSFKPSDLAARAIRVVIADEIDRFCQHGPEGNPLDLAIKRTATFSNRKVLIASTPTKRGGSAIVAEFDKSDKRLFHIVCPHCGDVAPIEFDRLTWPDGEPQKARLLCHSCGVLLTERERLDALDKGHWRATAEGEPGVVGFHASALISPFVSMESITREREAANTPDKLRVFHNTVLGLPFDEGAEVAVDAMSLREQAEHVAQPYSREIQFVSAGVDVQGNRLECTILAHLANKQRLVLDHIALPGDTTGDAVWADLDALLGRPIFLEDGRALPVAITGIDSGYQQSRVAAFVASQRAKMRRVIATKGVAGFGRALIREGAKIGRGVTRNWLIGVDDCKVSVTKALAAERDAPHAIRLPAHLPDDYFEGLASEQLTTAIKKSGHMTMQWQKIAPNVRNEALDCLCIAVAVASLVRSAPQAVNRAAAPKPKIENVAARLHAAVNGERNHYAQT